MSYYAFTAVVSDKTLQLEDQDWVTVNYEASAAENIMVIQKAFVRNDNNKNYVYKDDNGSPEETGDFSGCSCRQRLQCDCQRWAQ